jgi:nucleotide-binding universal stress UspA family protein
MTGMTDGIVVGYDGSPGGDEALRWAAREAWARGAALTICLAWPAPDLLLLGDWGAHDRARRLGGEILARGVRLAGAVPDLAEVRTVLAEGPPARVLCERSRTAEMVVAGSRGHGGLAELRLGSVSWQVACHGHGPVVVVRGQWRPVNQPPGPVAVGVDGSPHSQHALTFAFQEAALRGVPLVAVCALSDAPGRMGGALQMDDDVGRLLTRREKEHPEITVLRQVTSGTPRPALLSAAAEAQILVAGARGRGGLDGMSLGSVADALVHHSPCPVAIVHPAAQ